MCDELVKRMRDSEHEIDCSICDRDCCYPDGKVHGKCIIIEAADAIEELQQQVEHYHGCMNDWYQEACDYKTMVEQMKATVIVEAKHTEMYDERDKKTLLEMAKSLPLTLTPLQHCNTLDNDKMRWIPVTDRLPKAERKSYWVCTDTGYQCECRWTNDRFGIIESDEWGWKIFDIPQYQKVVAWMPLPDPYEQPKEET